MKLQPFKVAIPQSDINDLKARLVNTRWADDPNNDDWRYGVRREWLKDMVAWWSDCYDWRACEQHINRNPNFMVTIDDVPIHFVHVKGKGPRSIPLLLVHGWPWTFMDFDGLIGPLTDPANHGGNPAVSFDLIIPSLPGYGFSMPLTRAGLDIPAHAGLFHKLMHEILRYDHFAVAGGDWGAAITTWMGHAFPDSIIGVLASIPYFPGLDLNTISAADYAPSEQWMLVRQAETKDTVTSHFIVQSTDPQTLAYALVDSPVGTAAWLWERRRAWGASNFDPPTDTERDQLCTLASIYWLTRSIGTSMRTYWEHAKAGGLPMQPLHDCKPAISVPCAFTIFPEEVMLIPHSVAQSGANIHRWTNMSQGGHFGLSENPGETIAEIRAFFGQLCNNRQ